MKSVGLLLYKTLNDLADTETRRKMFILSAKEKLKDSNTPADLREYLEEVLKNERE